jgi:hypothetical protein
LKNVVHPQQLLFPFIFMKIIRIISKCFLALLCLACAVSCKKKVEKPPQSVNQTPSPELQAFFQSEVWPVLSELIAGKLPYPEINERYKSGIAIVEKEYGKALSCKLGVDYHPSDKGIEGSAGDRYDKDTGIIYIIVPAVKDKFEAMQASQQPKWREAFRSHVIVLFMHELEHLRFTLRMHRDEHIDMTEESRAWDETCKYVLEPLVAKYGQAVSPNDGVTLDCWLRAGRNINNPIWKREIELRYKDVPGAKW